MSFPIESLAETVPPTSSTENRCFYCKKISEVFCKECKENTSLSGHFCQECSIKTHQIFDSNQKHNPKIIKGVTPKSIEIPKKCSKHNKKFSSYCFDCNKLICIKGILREHKSHNIELIEEAIVKIDTNKLVEIKDLKQTVQEKEQSIQTIEKKCKEIEKQKKKLIKEINNKGQHLIDTINDKINEIINRVNNNATVHILFKNKSKNKSKNKNENKNENEKEKESESESDFKIDAELCLPISKQLRVIQDLSLQKQIDINNYVIKAKGEYQLGETVSLQLQLKQNSINYKNFLKEVDIELCIKINEKNIIQLNNFKYKPSKNDIENQNVGVYECNFKPSRIGNYKITILRFGSQETFPEDIGFKISKHSKKCFNPEKCGQYLKMTNNNKTIKNVGGNGTTWFTNQVEGFNIMKKGVHFYKFKIDHKTSNSFHIGVKIPNKNVKVSKDGWAYDIHMPSKFSHGIPEKWGQKCRTGDILTMKVDMDKKTLSYKRNNDDLGVAFKDLPNECVLAVCIYAEDQQITIL